MKPKWVGWSGVRQICGLTVYIWATGKIEVRRQGLPGTYGAYVGWFIREKRRS